MVSKYPEIARIARDNIYTDIPAQNLPAFVDLIERVQKSGKINSLALSQIPDFSSGKPDYDVVHAFIQKGIAPPKPTKPKPTGTATTTPTKTPTPSPSDHRRRTTSAADPLPFAASAGHNKAPGQWPGGFVTND